MSTRGFLITTLLHKSNVKKAEVTSSLLFDLFWTFTVFYNTFSNFFRNFDVATSENIHNMFYFLSWIYSARENFQRYKKNLSFLVFNQVKESVPSKYAVIGY